MLITNYNSIMHTFYYYNHMYIKTKRDFFLLSNSFLTSGTILWSVIIDSVLTWVTRGPPSAYIWSLQNYICCTYCIFLQFLLKAQDHWAMRVLCVAQIPTIHFYTSPNLCKGHQMIIKPATECFAQETHYLLKLVWNNVCCWLLRPSLKLCSRIGIKFWKA